MTYEDIIYYLENQKKRHGVNYIKEALLALELKIDPSRVIIVAGTNGKGSTCATLQTLLQAAGKNVGFFSSPHLIKTNERIKFNGEDISDDNFCAVFSKIHKKVEHFALSHFEYLTIMAAYYFFEVHRREIDFAIFEVGLGGILDATNAIPHNTSVITKLGFDHEAVLGNDMVEIAKNKFGIISPYNQVFHTKFCDHGVKKLSEKYIKKLNCDFIEAYQCNMEVDTSNVCSVFKIKTPFGDFPLNLPGARAVENTALAITIFDKMIGNAKKFLPALRKVNWPGRMEEFIYQGRRIFLSGDHNPQGIESLLEILDHYKFENAHFVVGICHSKNHSEMLKKLNGVKNSHLYLTETPFKTLPLAHYDEKFAKLAAFSSKDPIETLDVALSRAKNNDLVIVTGSLYLVGLIKKQGTLCRAI